MSSPAPSDAEEQARRERKKAKKEKRKREEAEAEAAAEEDEGEEKPPKKKKSKKPKAEVVEAPAEDEEPAVVKDKKPRKPPCSDTSLLKLASRFIDEIEEIWPTPFKFGAQSPDTKIVTEFYLRHRALISLVNHLPMVHKQDLDHGKVSDEAKRLDGEMNQMMSLFVLAHGARLHMRRVIKMADADKAKPKA